MREKTEALIEEMENKYGYQGLIEKIKEVGTGRDLSLNEIESLSKWGKDSLGGAWDPLLSAVVVEKNCAKGSKEMFLALCAKSILENFGY